MTTAANISFSWVFPQLECFPAKEGLTNVVKTVHWRLRGDDGEGHSGERYGSIDLGDADPKNFAAFDSLNEEVVAAWVSPLLKLDDLKASITEQINNLRNPPVVILTLPKKDAE